MFGDGTSVVTNGISDTYGVREDQVYTTQFTGEATSLHRTAALPEFRICRATGRRSFRIRWQRLRVPGHGRRYERGRSG